MVSGWVGGWVDWGGFGRFSLPFARVFEAQLSSLPQHVVPRTVPTRRHQLTEIALPDGCRVPYGGGLRRAQQVIRGRTAVTLDECDAAPAARGVQTRGDHRLRRARRRGGRYYLLSPGERRRRCRVGGALPTTYSPHSQTRLLTRPAVLWCVAWDASAAEMSRPGRTLRLEGYYLPSGGRRRRYRGGGELPVANTRLTVQDGGSRPRPCSGVPL